MEEWVFGTTIGDLKGLSHRDPFPHSLLRTREERTGPRWGL